MRFSSNVEVIPDTGIHASQEAAKRFSAPREREHKKPPMRKDTRQQKPAMAGLWAISGERQMLGTLVRVIGFGKQALGAWWPRASC